MTFQHAFDRVKRVCMAAAVMMVMAMLFMASLVLPTTLPTHATAGAGQFFALDTAVAAENSSDKDSWTAVAELISTDLNAGVESLNAGDSTSAASAFQRAYNVDYVASNMTVVAEQYADATTAQSVKSELMALTTDVYNLSLIHI